MGHPICCFVFMLWANMLFSADPPVCPITANAGNDITICEPGTVTLNGSVAGLYSAVSWTPAAGMSDPNSLNPSVYVSQTTTFTLNAVGSGAQNNLIVNGDFSAGSANFTSQYIEMAGPLWPEGVYAISTNSSLLHPNWAACTDHTGGGNMMVVNGSTFPNENVWCQNVPVVPNTTYEFSAWLTSVISSNPALLQFSINGVLLGSPFNVPGATCLWTEFFETWNSGGATSAEICIVNQNTAAGGNDFAIDDISFGPVCEDDDQVTVTVAQVDAFADPVATIPCNNNGAGIPLNGTGSSVGPDYSYLWTTINGNIVSGGNTLTPIVNAAGTYTLTVTFDNGQAQCTETVDVVVTNDIPPEAMATSPSELTCSFPEVYVDGLGSTVGPNIVYEWTTTDGNITSGANSIQASVNLPGTYTLLVTDVVTGCTATATTLVNANLVAPSAEAIPEGDIDCTADTVSIDGSSSSGAGNLLFSWSTSNGNIVSAANIPVIEVDEPGTYELVVTDEDNGCSSLVLAEVEGNNDPPEPSIDPPGVLSCDSLELTLDAGSSSGDSLSFSWSTSGGNILSGGQTATPVVDEPGTYILVLTDNENGCTATDSVEVTGNNNLPAISFSPPEEITCFNTEVTLDASGSGAGLTYEWTTANGNILSGENSAMPVVDAAGTYTLIVTNPQNGCTASDDILVSADQTPPIADAGDPLTLDCNETSLNLDGSGSSTGPGFTYNWTTGNGNIVNGQNTLSPEVDAPGTYVLTVTNTNNGCTSTASVEVSENSDQPVAVAGVDEELNCNNLTLIIDGTGSSSGPGFVIAWTTQNGNILNGASTLEPEVNEPGTYTLTITNSSSGCTAAVDVTVTENLDTPSADAGPPVTLNCLTPSLQLDGTGSVPGNNAIISWSTQNGNILNGANTLEPEVNAAGDYMLLITNSESGCTDTAMVVVGEDMQAPTADAGTGDELNCVVTSLFLDGGNSSMGANFTYEWTTSNGNIITGQQTLSPEIDAPGTYVLTVVNTENGCESTSEVDITQDGDFPSVDAGPGAELTCSTGQVTLSGNGDSGSGFLYQWSTPDGNIVSGSTTLTPVVDATGTYTLTITNQGNGCSASASTDVSGDFTPPSADAGPTAQLSCTQTQVSLSGSGSAPGNDLLFSWTTANGNILSGAGTPDPVVNAAGDYLLTVTNNANGCTATSSVTITEDDSLPTADAGTAEDLSCTVLSVLLDGSGSSSGQDFSYSWSTLNGNIVSGANTLAPEVDAPGTYLLTVTNLTTNCESYSTVSVLSDTDAPVADAGPDGLLTCITEEITLDGTASTNSTAITFSWSTQNGNISSGNTTATPVVSAPGNYLLLVTNTINGCTATDEVVVNEDTSPPDAAASVPGMLTCETLTLQLDGSGSSTGPGFSYGWTTANGNLTGGTSTLAPQVNAPGLYELLVTNDQTGCTATATVEVLENTLPPVADAGPVMELNCDQTIIFLDGSNSSQGPNFSYQWTTQGGTILSGGSSLSPEIGAAGTYTLIVTDADNGCSSTAQVEVVADDQLPQASILMPEVLTCSITEVVLDATGSSAGSQFAYSWTTQNGNIVSGDNSPEPLVNEPGVYQLTIINTDNGCETTAQVTVEQDVDLPVAEAGQPVELHCNFTEASLSGSTDLDPSMFTASWTTADGNIAGDANTLAPVVDAPGIYVLTVVNIETQCASTDQVTVTENIFTGLSYTSEDPACNGIGGIIEFAEPEGGQPPYSYSIDDGASFSSQDIFTNLDAGTFQLTVQDANGCTLSDEVYLSPPPPVVVSLEANALIQLGESYQLNAQTNVPQSEIGLISWSPSEGLSCDDCLNPVATPIQQTSYTVTVENQAGCRATAVMTLVVKKDISVYVPNAFSPNGDGINDLFMIYGGEKSILNVKTFQVFDRWGESVFSYFNFLPNDPAFGWDGLYRGQELDPAVFVWFAELELIDGSELLMKGDVTLVR